MIKKDSQQKLLGIDTQQRRQAEISNRLFIPLVWFWFNASMNKTVYGLVRVSVYCNSTNGEWHSLHLRKITHQNNRRNCGIKSRTRRRNGFELHSPATAKKTQCLKFHSSFSFFLFSGWGLNQALPSQHNIFCINPREGLQSWSEVVTLSHVEIPQLKRSWLRCWTLFTRNLAGELARTWLRAGFTNELNAFNSTRTRSNLFSRRWGEGFDRVLTEMNAFNLLVKPALNRGGSNLGPSLKLSKRKNYGCKGLY